MAMTGDERHSKVGPYILMDTLGTGSFGKVKLAVHESTYERFACKILDKSLVRERVLSIQVRKEIAIMKRLKHRNTVSLVSVLSTKSKVFMVMELVNGGELFEEIMRHKRLSESYARFYFRQLIEGLQYCHDHGVYHRDLKPENLLLDENKTLKITDFGLSSLRAGDGSNMVSVTDTLNLHTQCGTPNYVAPEIITLDSGGYSGAKVDAWSCGIILYVLVAGALPFDADDTEMLFKHIMRCDITYPPFFSEDLIDLVSNLLKTKPEDRYSIADVKLHPWYNGIVKDSMDGESLYTAVTQSLSSSQLSSSADIPGDLAVSGAESYIEGEVYTTGIHGSGTASMLSKYMQKRSSMRFSRMAVNTHATHDSLDVGIRAESVDSKLAFEEAPAFSGQPTTPLLPATIWDSGNQDGGTVSAESPTQAAGSPAPSVPPGSLKNPIARLRSRVFGESEASSSRNSDDDLESEFEDIQELRTSNKLSGPKRREFNSGPMNHNPVAMRRVSSWNHLGENERAKTAADKVTSTGKEELVAGGCAIRRRLKRELWNRDAGSWRSTATSYHHSNSKSWSHDVESKLQTIRSDADPQQRVENEMDQSGTGVGDKEHGERLGVSTTVANDNNDLELSCIVSTGERNPLQSIPSRGSRLKRSLSHDGAIPERRKRRPRAKPKHEISIKRHTSDLNGKPFTYTFPSTDNLASENGGAPNSGGVSYRTILRGPHQFDGSTERERRNKVRFKIGSNESQEEFSPHSGGDWVRNDLGKMLWCRMMKDYDMIPDDDEFEMDSMALHKLWTDGLKSENFRGKSSVVHGFRSFSRSSAATLHGPLAPAMSRSTRYLSSEASRSEVKRWNTQGYDSSRFVGNKNIGNDSHFSSVPIALCSEMGVSNSSSSTSECEDNETQSVLVKTARCPAVTLNCLGHSPPNCARMDGRWPQNPSPSDILMWMGKGSVSRQISINAGNSNATEDSEVANGGETFTDTSTSADSGGNAMRVKALTPRTPSGIRAVEDGEAHKAKAMQDDSRLGVHGGKIVIAQGSGNSRESKLTPKAFLRLGEDKDLLSSDGSYGVEEDSLGDERSERVNSYMSMREEASMRSQGGETESSEKARVYMRRKPQAKIDAVTEASAISRSPRSVEDELVESNEGGSQLVEVHRECDRGTREDYLASGNLIREGVGKGMQTREIDEIRAQGETSKNVKQDINKSGIGTTQRDVKEKGAVEANECRGVRVRNEEGTLVGLLDEVVKDGNSERCEKERAGEKVVKERIEGAGGNEEKEIEKVELKGRSQATMEGVENEEEDGLTSRSTGGRAMTVKSSGSSSRNELDVVSPFLMEIPGPRRMLVVSKKKWKLGLGGTLPRVGSARRLRERWPTALYGGVYTQFHSIMRPEVCHELMGKLLKDQGCSYLKGTRRKSKNRYKIKWEKKKDGMSIAGTVLISAYDEILSSVVFKKSVQTDSKAFIAFYSDIYRMYGDKTKKKGDAAEKDENARDVKRADVSAGRGETDLSEGGGEVGRAGSGIR